MKGGDKSSTGGGGGRVEPALGTEEGSKRPLHFPETESLARGAQESASSRVRFHLWRHLHLLTLATRKAAGGGLGGRTGLWGKAYDDHLVTPATGTGVDVQARVPGIWHLRWSPNCHPSRNSSHVRSGRSPALSRGSRRGRCGPVRGSKRASYALKSPGHRLQRPQF